MTAIIMLVVVSGTFLSLPVVSVKRRLFGAL
jgi:hypothetical protein